MTKEEQRDYAREYRAFRKRLNLCISCGTKDEYTISGRSYCFNCTEKYRKLSKENYKKKSSEERAEYNRKRKERWRKRKAEHRCPRCNKELEAENKYILCPSCREKAKIKSRETKAKGGEQE